MDHSAPERPVMSPGTRSGSTNMFSAGRRWFVQNPHLSVFLHTFVDTNFQIQFPLKVENSINILLLVVGCGEFIFYILARIPFIFYYNIKVSNPKLNNKDKLD